MLSSKNISLYFALCHFSGLVIIFFAFLAQAAWQELGLWHYGNSHYLKCKCPLFCTLLFPLFFFVCFRLEFLWGKAPTKAGTP